MRKRGAMSINPDEHDARSKINKTSYSRPKDPNDNAVSRKRGDHQHGVDESEAIVPVFADGGEIPPMLVDHVLMFFWNVPSQHVLFYLFGYPENIKRFDWVIYYKTKILDISAVLKLKVLIL